MPGTLHRRSFLGSAATALLPVPAFAQSPRAKTLRFIPSSNLVILDPVWTTLGITMLHAYYVFDMLYAVDSKLQPQPQMAEGHSVSDDERTWLIRLRDGLKFHDGEPVRANDCAASIRRWGARDSFGQVLLAACDAIEAANDRTIRFRLKRPFPHLLDALAHPIASVCPIMPERLAKTDPNTQVTEMVGSGPFRFLKDEFVTGSRVAYAKFEDYVPRREPADWASGGKRAYFDRVEWHIIPDPATAAAALQSGEMDWWDIAMPDLVPMLQHTGQITVAYTDPLGYDSILRFNCINPPFDNPALRRAVLGAVDQGEYMQAINASDKAWRTCYAVFACGLPHVRELGADVMRPPKDLESSKAAVAAAGYKGEKAVIINPTDIPSIAPHGELTADLLKKLGMNVELQAMDAGTWAQRRTSKEPVERGGWSIFHTNAPSIALGTPTLNFYIRGQGANGWLGWFKSDEMEKLCDEWLNSGADEQDHLFDAIQTLAFQQAPMVPLGQYEGQTAYRNDLSGVILAALNFPWNVRRA